MARAPSDLPTLERIGLPDATSRIAVGVVTVAVLGAVASIDAASAALAAGKVWVVDRFDGLFVLAANLSIVVIVLAAFHPSARGRLGAEDERPQFGRLAWLSMLFSAGLASGLLYWATAEPILHFQENPFASPGESPAMEARAAMRITMLHWGLHGWAFYVLVGLGIAIPAYRHGQPLAFRAVLHPLVGARWVERWPGRALDLLAVFGTICGVATSIGLSAASMNATLSSLVDVSVSIPHQVSIILGVCVLGIVSALSGLARGILWLSVVNAWVSAGLVAAFLLLGPTGEVVELLVRTFGDYALHAIPDGLWVGTTPEARAWQGDWTIFYWGWWLAWTPFVSLFIARISRGRTVREFILAVGLVPTAVTLVWMSVLGGTALVQELAMSGAVSRAVNVDYSLGLVAVIENLADGPMATALLSVSCFLLFTWLVTSLDSATLVMCHLLGVEEVAAAKVFWGLALAAVAAVLLVAGGLHALQAASIMIGLPLAVVVMFVALGLARRVLTGRL